MISLTEKQLQTLYCLSTFHFLTYEQLEECGIAHYTTLRRDIMPKLIRQRKSFVKEHDLGVLAGVGRLKKIFYLTKYGAEIVAEAYNLPFESIYTPQGVFFRREYHHRLAYVSTKIKAYQWAGVAGKNIAWIDDYQHSGGNHRAERRQVSKTQIELDDGTRIKPDGLFKITDQDGAARACVLELHRGKDAQRCTDQLRLNVQGITQGHYQDKIGVEFEHGALLLSVHDGDTLNATKARMREALPPALLPLVLFNSTETIKAQGFNQGWTTAESKPHKALFE